MRATSGAPLGQTENVRAWERAGAKTPAAFVWKSSQGMAAGPRWRAGRGRVPCAAGLTLQVYAIDDSGIGDDGDLCGTVGIQPLLRKGCDAWRPAAVCAAPWRTLAHSPHC